MLTQNGHLTRPWPCKYVCLQKLFDSFLLHCSLLDAFSACRYREFVMTWAWIYILCPMTTLGVLLAWKVGESSITLSFRASIFWSSSTTFIDPPFSPEEDYTYSNRMHPRPPAELYHGEDNLVCSDNGPVSHMLFINSTYDSDIQDFSGPATNPR